VELLTVDLHAADIIHLGERTSPDVELLTVDLHAAEMIHLGERPLSLTWSYSQWICTRPKWSSILLPSQSIFQYRGFPMLSPNCPYLNASVTRGAHV
jgi:hypothetical protein